MKPTALDEQKYSLRRVSPAGVQLYLESHPDLDSLCGYPRCLGVLCDGESDDTRDPGLYLMSGGMESILGKDFPSLRGLLLGAGRGIVPSLPHHDYFFAGTGAAAYVVLDSWHAFEMVMQERPVLRVSRFDFQQDLLLLVEDESHPDSPLVRGISRQAHEYTRGLIGRMVRIPGGEGIRLLRAMADADLDLDSLADKQIDGYKSKKTD